MNITSPYKVHVNKGTKSRNCNNHKIQEIISGKPCNHLMHKCSCNYKSHYRHSPPVSGANDKNTTQDGHKTSRSGQWTRRPEQVVRTTGDEVCCGDGGTAGGGAAGMSK